MTGNLPVFLQRLWTHALRVSSGLFKASGSGYVGAEPEHINSHVESPKSECYVREITSTFLCRQEYQASLLPGDIIKVDKPMFLKHFLKKFIYLFLAALGLRFCARAFSSCGGGHSSSRCTGLSLLRPLLLQSTGSRRAGSVVVAHGPSRSVACGILPDQGSNPCRLHWQADSQPLRHQGSP